MNRNALFVLGLLAQAGCDALWSSQLSTDPGLCTQSSSLCPSGQVCDFTSGTCQPLGGVNPSGWSITPTTISSCPQTPAPVITITGPVSSQTPAVSLNGVAVDPSNVSLQSGSLQVTLPRQLAAGAVQVSLTYKGSPTPVMLNPGFQYSVPAHTVTALQSLDGATITPPMSVAQVAAWQAQKGGPLELAVLSGSGTQISHYRDSAVATRQPAMFTSVGSAGMLGSNQAIVSGNLAVADDGLGQGTQELIAATSTAGQVGFFIGGSDTPIVKTASLPNGNTVTRQLVAGGYFKDGNGPVQALSFVGWTSGGSVLPIELNSSPNYGGAGSNFLMWQGLPFINPQPLALAAGQLNNDATTDVVVIVGASVTSTTNYAYTISGGGTVTPLLFSNLPASVTTVALGNVDKDRLPDAVFGLNPGPGQPGQIRVFLNQSAKVTPAVAWDTSNPIQVSTALAPTAVAVADYDGDGVNDILYAATDGVHVLLNQLDVNGRPTLTDTLVYRSNRAAWSVTSLIAVDISGDSRPDVILAESQQNIVQFLENTCLPPGM